MASDRPQDVNSRHNQRAQHSDELKERVKVTVWRTRKPDGRGQTIDTPSPAEGRPSPLRPTRNR